MKAALFLSLLPAAVVATVGGHCSGSNANANCICLHRSTCQQYSAQYIVTGSPGDYPCPYDANDVVGCYFHCKTTVPDTRCEFTDGCRSHSGSVLSGALCPGGDDFACCRYSLP